jgi:hypothetical protein
MKKDKPANKTAKTEQPEIVKRIGNTTYRVKVHFNPNSKETFTDKVLRLIRNEKFTNG